MSPRYSRHKSKFFVDPDHEAQAHGFVNSLGNRYVLEGALDLGSGDLRIWYQDITTNDFACKVIPITKDFNYNTPLFIETEKMIEKIPEEEKDLATDEQFLIEKK